jgi:hypothetical protein
VLRQVEVTGVVAQHRNDMFITIMTIMMMTMMMMIIITLTHPKRRSRAKSEGGMVRFDTKRCSDKLKSRELLPKTASSDTRPM